MALARNDLEKLDIVTAVELMQLPGNQFVRVAGCVIARQRPRTAKGFVCLSLEDETGIANILLTPDILSGIGWWLRVTVFCGLRGRCRTKDGVVHVKAQRIFAISITDATIRSRDFH